MTLVTPGTLVDSGRSRALNSDPEWHSVHHTVLALVRARHSSFLLMKILNYRAKLCGF